MTKTPSATKNRQDEVPVEDLLKRLVLTGADIVRIGEDAELLVGGKNYNTALISRKAFAFLSSAPFRPWRSTSCSTNARCARR